MLGARAKSKGPALLARPAVSGSNVLGIVLSFTLSAAAAWLVRRKCMMRDVVDDNKYLFYGWKKRFRRERNR